MKEVFKALYKIDNTICLNNLKQNISWNIDNEKDSDPNDTDCKSIEDYINCYDKIERTLLNYIKLKEAITYYKKLKEEIDSGKDSEGNTLTEREILIKTNLYNTLKLLDNIEQ